VTLFDHIPPQQRAKMAAMLRPVDGIGPTFHRFSIFFAEEDDLRELCTQRSLPSLLPFKHLMNAMCTDRAKKLTVITSPTHDLEAIYIVPEDETLQPFMLPQHVWQQVCLELGLEIPQSSRS